MHFEILVEDISGKNILDILLPKIIGDPHTFKVHSFKGIGHIPKNLHHKNDRGKEFLLSQLPQILKAYGKNFENYQGAVIIVCDLDNKNREQFYSELNNILNSCNPKPLAEFCFAIEEGEAWLLGDIAAIKAAYPTAKESVMNSYKNDSICGTWELLADAIYPNGRAALSNQGFHLIGKNKSEWAKKIGSHMDIGANLSPSFQFFKNTLLRFVQT